MQDYNRAIIVGCRETFGKGTVQRFFDMDRFLSKSKKILSPIGSIKLTIQKFYRINGESTQYTVTSGSKIIRRKKANGDPVEVHSYITPGDWIFVGQLTTDAVRKVDATYSDDPYEYSYQVRDVNYDKIVLWLPYKGEQEGSS